MKSEDEEDAMPNEEHGGIPKISRLIFFVGKQWVFASMAFHPRRMFLFFFLEGTMRRSSQEFLNPSQDAIAPDQKILLLF